MKQLKLTVQINKPVNEVYGFTLNPENTPKWIDDIIKEEASPMPVRLGTLFRNTGDGTTWATYEITQLDPGVMFVMSRHDANYHVRYVFAPTQSGTELEYTEWTDEGELEKPFTMEPLEKLKLVLEEM